MSLSSSTIPESSPTTVSQSVLVLHKTSNFGCLNDYRIYTTTRVGLFLLPRCIYGNTVYWISKDWTCPKWEIFRTLVYKVDYEFCEDILLTMRRMKSLLFFLWSTIDGGFYVPCLTFFLHFSFSLFWLDSGSWVPFLLRTSSDLLLRINGGSPNTPSGSDPSVWTFRFRGPLPLGRTVFCLSSGLTSSLTRRPSSVWGFEDDL